MAVIDNIRRAISAMERHDYTGGMQAATLVIEPAAKLKYGVSRCGRQKYIQFLHDSSWLIETFGGLSQGTIIKKKPNIVILDERGKKVGGNDGPDLAQIIYHQYRCSIHHGDDIPKFFKLAPMGLSPTVITAEEAFHPPPQIVYGLLAASAFSNSNRPLAIDPSLSLSFNLYEIVEIDVSETESREKIIHKKLRLKKILQFPLVDYWGAEQRVRTEIESEGKIDRKVLPNIYLVEGEKVRFSEEIVM